MDLSRDKFRWINNALSEVLHGLQQLTTGSSTPARAAGDMESMHSSGT